MNLFYFTSGLASLTLLILLIVFVHPSLFASVYHLPFFILIAMTIFFFSRTKLNCKVSLLNALVILLFLVLAYLGQLTILNFLLLISFWLIYLYLHYKK